MIKVVLVWNFLLSVLIIGILFRDFHAVAPASAGSILAVVKTTKLEITDDSGKTLATLGTNLATKTPELSFYDTSGRKAAMLMVDDRGFATLFFDSNRVLGKVAMGYLHGGDTPVPLDQEDPTGAWGIQVRGEKGVKYYFGAEADGRPLSTK